MNTNVRKQRNHLIGTNIHKKVLGGILTITFSLVSCLPAGAAVDWPAPEKFLDQMWRTGTIDPDTARKEVATPELNLNQAIGLALSNSKSIQKAEKEIDRTKELRDDKTSQLDFIPKMPGTPYTEIPVAQMLTADLQWRMSKRSYTSEEDKVALDTCKKYWDVQVAQDKLQLAEVNAQRARRQLMDAQAGYQAGTAHEVILMGAEAQDRGAQAQLASAKNELNKSYVSFNQLIGLWPEDRPVLTEEVAFQPLQVASLNHEVARVLNDCPSVWLLERKAVMQEYLQDMMYYTGEYRPYKAREIEVDQARLEAASGKELFENVTRSIYYGVKSLEEAYAGTMQEVTTRERELQDAQLKYEVGMATQFEVKAAEAQLADAKSRAFAYAAQHAYMKLAFEKPWAYLSGLQDM